MGVQYYRMRFKQIAAIVCVVTVFLCLGADPVLSADAGTGNEYYVDIDDPSASDDTGTGDVLLPWKTLHHAVNQLQPGDTLYVQPGTYSVANGEADSLLTIYTGNIRIIGNGAAGTVVIDGTATIYWQNYGIQVYDEIGNVSGVVIQNVDIRNFSENGIRIDGARNTLIQNCRIYQNAVAGINIGGAGQHRIEGSTIFDNGASGTPGAGILVNSENNIISGNQVYWSGSAIAPNFPQGVGVDITSPTGNEVRSNEVYGHTSGSLPAGIKVMGSYGTARVNDNRIHDNTTGVYVFESAPEIQRNFLKDNTTGIFVSYNYINSSPRIINNLITGATAVPSTTSIGINVTAMPSGPAPAVLIYHNTIYGAADRAIRSNVGGMYATAPEIRYNIISNTTWGSGIFQETGTQNPVVGYNLFYANVTDYSGGTLGATNLTGQNPLFVDAPNGNCRLQTTSPAVDAIPEADHNKAVDEDFDRVSRPQNTDYDMGCFEAFVFFSPNITWDGGLGGTGTSWSVAANWNPDSVPAATDRVLIPSGFNVDMDAVMPDNAILSIENHGTLTLLSGKTLIVGGVNSFATNAPDGTLRGEGTLDVSGTDSTDGNYGTLAPGTSAGTLTIAGGCRMDASARVEIEIGGTDPGMFDKLIVNGQLAADGELYVTLIDDYTPQIGHSFEIMTFTSLTGFFDPVILPSLPDGLVWRQTLNTGSLVLDVVASNDGGTGTEFDPYRIATPEQLNHVRKLPGKYFKQVANIDLGGFAFSSGSGWDPIGRNGNCFTGSYDGNGFTISSLTIDRPSEEIIGLFGCVGGAGVLKNISLNNSSINGYARVGAIAGDNSGVIAHCSATTCSVAGVSAAGTHVGGLVGYNTGQVEQCHAAVTVNGPENIGGLVGYHENGTISQSYAEGPVTGEISVGGFAGSAEYGKMINCFAAGSVTGTDNVGGFMGEGWTAYVTNCYAVGPVSGAASVGGLIGVKTYSTVTNSYYDSETTGQSDTGQGEPRTTAEMKTGAPSGSIYTDWYTFIWDFEPTDAYPILRWTGWGQSTGWQYPINLDDTVNAAPWPNGQIRPQVAMGGNGETLIVWAQYDGSYSRINKNEYRGGIWSGPEIISSPTIDAYSPQVAMDGNGNAVIVWQQSDGTKSQIYKSEYRSGVWTHPADLSDHISIAGTDAYNPQVVMAGSGDAVVVWYQSDGSNNQIYKSEYRSGVWTHPADLSDHISTSGTDATSPQVAMDDNGIATNADAVIVWQQYDGVSYNLIYKSEYRGGAWTHPADLSDYVSSPGVYASSPQVAMAANGDAVIVWEQSGSNTELYMMEYRNMTTWSSPAMISPSGSGAGVSQVAMNKTNGDTIIVWTQGEEFSYGKRIFMSEYRSGVWLHPLTRNDYISPAGYEADNAHAAVDGNGNAVIVWFSKGNGVYTGWISMMEYRGGVWKHPADIPPVGKIDTYMPNPYSPKVAMADSGDAVIAWDVFVGKDETTGDPIWRVYKSEYRSSGANPFAGGDGTELDPYQIETAAQLAAVKDYLDGYFILNADIDLNLPPWNDGAGWEPIGTEGEPFAGHFEGNCKTISNLFIDRSGEDFVGLFGYVAPGAEVKKIALMDVNLTGRDAVGALAGKNQGEPISECLATGTVTGGGSGTGGVGGLVGYNAGGIADSYAAVHVTGTGQYTGGLVGKNFGGSITASYSSGQVTGDATAGGLVGVYDGTPDNVVDSYWNTETSGQSASEGGDPLTTAQMRQQSSFPIWEVSGLWGFVEGVSFPYLVCHGQIQFTLTYTADANGSITGPTPQVLDHGKDSLPVSADPLSGFLFGIWSDGSIQNPRIDTAVSNITVTASFDEAIDFGDAPDPTYPTLLASDGARHLVVAGYYLGSGVDGESDGQPGVAALGDDNDDGNDDEDGVVFGAFLIPCGETPVTVTASGAGYINAWIDFNADGDWADAGEQVFSDQALTAGANSLNFTVPCDAALGKTFARFRFSSPGGLSYTGLAADGEVEDYAVDIFASPASLGAVPAVPDTGQDLCYDNAAAISCPGLLEAFYGQDTHYQPQHPRSYTKLGVNGVELPDTATQPQWLMTRDNVTGLIWEIKTADNMGDSYTWANATSVFLAGLNAAGGFGGFSDWRLPTVKELSSLVDSGFSNPAIDEAWFPQTLSSGFWTSSDFILIPTRAWVVGFSNGFAAGAGKDGGWHARAVRGGKQPGVFDDAALAGTRIDNGDGTVTDTVTGLMWQQATDPSSPCAWVDALGNAEGLSLAGHNDWRLPNRNELQSLVDYTRSYPAIDSTLFPDAGFDLYWSSTTDIGSPINVWRINFQDGGVDSSVAKTDSYAFRAVRGGQFGNADTHISSPAQGGEYALGDPLPITWTPLDGVGNVRILLSRDGGVTFEEIVPSTENDGDFEWLVAGLATANGMIRIEDAADSAIFKELGFFALGEVVNLFVTTETTEGSGTVTSVPAGIACGADCVGVFPKDTMIQLSAVPDPGSIFTGWTNGTGSAAGCSGTGTCSFTITEASSIKATFGAIGPGEYFVDSATGNDANDGASAVNPWRTLHHAIDLINGGTTGNYTLNVAAGEYKFISNGGYETDAALYITQSNLEIIGAGITTIVDGTFVSDPIWIDGFDIQAPATNVLIRDLVVKSFFANGIHMGGATGCTVDACTIYDNLSNGITIEMGGVPFIPSSGNVIGNETPGTGCQIFNNGNAGIYIYSSNNNKIVNNSGSIYDNGASDVGYGIKISGDGSINSNNDISGNHIHYSGNTTHRQLIGIYLENIGVASQTDIEQNQIESHDLYGIQIVEGGCRIKRNLLMNNGRGIYVVAQTGETSPAIWNNLIWSGEVANMDYGIYLEAASLGQITTNLTIYNNTIDRAITDGIYVDATTLTAGGLCEPSIFYNIISNSQSYGINNVSGAATVGNGYNNVTGSGVSDYAGIIPIPVPGDGSGSISSDPLYVADGTDYHLGVGSPCMDASTGGFGPDLEGNSRPIDIASVDNGGAFDMGCYEATTSGLTYTVDFIAGAGGSIGGILSQTVAEGSNCTPVTAVPESGYEFIGWTGDYTGSANPLTITNVTSNMTITANFREKSTVVTRTVRFTAGQGGRVDGDVTQTVTYGENTSPVMAVPEFGYEFAGWTGDYTGTANPLTITNVTSNMTVTANFTESPATHTVRFIAGPGGSIQGDLSQTVEEGGSCSAVTAVPESGYEFAGWSGGYTGAANPLTITNVTSNMTVTANFEPKSVTTYTVKFVAAAGGRIDGSLTQVVPEGTDSLAVTAVPASGYEFTGWTGDYSSAANPLTITGVMSDMTVYANFREQAAVTFTVSFSAGTGGRLEGNPAQTVAEGGSCSSVRAAAEPGYKFIGWSGDYTGAGNPLTIANVISNMTIIAGFEENTGNQPPEKPELIAPAGNTVVPSGPVTLRSGPYADPENDPHSGTWWQVSRSGIPGVVYSEASGTDLEAHAIIQGLDAGLQYTWQAAYQDAGSGQYTWSDPETFVVGESTVDENMPPVVPGIGVGDYRMISFIQWPLDPSAMAVFGPLMGDGYDASLFRIGTYDPLYGAGGYREYPDFTVRPGRPCWFLARDGLDLSFEGVPVSTSVDIYISLKYNTASGNGWNMIAPPNDRDYRWGDLQVMVKDGSGNTVLGPTPISEITEDNPYIDTRIFGWDDGAYTASTLADFLLERYSGYWVRAKQENIYLCFPADVGIALRSGGFIGGIWNRLTAWVGNLLPETGTAYANAPTDAPPMPMAGLETDKAGGIGCFIDTIVPPPD